MNSGHDSIVIGRDAALASNVRTVGNSILRHSPWDALLIALAVLHGVLLLVVPSVPLVALGLWWNANTVSHNFIHLPFFRSRVGNRLFSAYLSLLLGLPQSLWKARHLAHHQDQPFRWKPVRREWLGEGALVLLLGWLCAESCVRLVRCQNNQSSQSSSVIDPFPLDPLPFIRRRARRRRE